MLPDQLRRIAVGVVAQWAAVQSAKTVQRRFCLTEYHFPPPGVVALILSRLSWMSPPGTLHREHYSPRAVHRRRR